MGRPILIIGMLIPSRPFKFSAKKAKYLKNPRTRRFAIRPKEGLLSPFLYFVSFQQILQ